MQKRDFQNTNIIIISVGHMFHDIFTSFLAPMLPFLIKKFGITLFESGFLDVALRAPSLLNPVVGLIADKMSVRYFVIAAPAVSAIAMSLLGVAPLYTVLLVLLFVTGISSTFFHVPSPVMIKQISGGKTGTGMSFYMFGGEIARTLGPLLITYAISIWGLEGSYRVMPIGILASFILYFKLKDIKISGKFHNGQKKTGVRITIKKFIPFFILVAGFSLFRAIVKSALTLYLPIYLTSKGNSIWFAASSLSILQFAGAVGTFCAGFISDKIGKTNTLLIAGLVTPLFMWLFVNSNSSGVIIAVLVLMGFFLFASGPVMLALVQDTNSTRPSFINSVYMTINFCINSLMVLFIGYIGDKIGLDITYKFCAVFSVLTIPFILLLSRRKK